VAIEIRGGGARLGFVWRTQGLEAARVWETMPAWRWLPL
jgi:hypothetical protein